MALYKRGKTWHTDFSVDGQRFRQSLDTTDWREAQAQEKVLIGAAKAGKLSATKQVFARLTFREAAERFLQECYLCPHSRAKSCQHRERHDQP